MKKQGKNYVIEKCYLTNIYGLSPSQYGNPRYAFEAHAEDGTTYDLKTATDSACAYGIRNYEAYYTQEEREIDGETYRRKIVNIRAYCDVTFHRTRTGNFVATYIEPHTERSASNDRS